MEYVAGKEEFGGGGREERGRERGGREKERGREGGVMREGGREGEWGREPYTFANAPPPFLPFRSFSPWPAATFLLPTAHPHLPQPGLPPAGYLTYNDM